MRYNYVFFWNPERYYEIAFSDVLGLDNVRYIPNLPRNSNKLIKSLHVIHHSSSINKIIQLPLRNVWRKHYFVNDFENSDPIIFVFHGSYYWMRSIGYFGYLKKHYPGSKCVLLLMDTVDSYKRYFSGKFCGDFDDTYIQKVFDLVLTYNLLDAQNYDYIYYPSIYSRDPSRASVGQATPANDIFFVGRAKDRLNLIHSAFATFRDNGLICDFYVTGVPKQEQLYGEIKYDRPLTYDQVLDHVENSKGILELVQGGAEGFTFRMDEALTYDRNLITNNPIVETLPYKDSSKIYHYSGDMVINKEEYDANYSRSYHYQDEYSPLRLLSYLESEF